VALDPARVLARVLEVHPLGPLERDLVAAGDFTPRDKSMGWNNWGVWRALASTRCCHDEATKDRARLASCRVAANKNIMNITELHSD
jgi:hypothetical protein